MLHNIEKSIDIFLYIFDWGIIFVGFFYNIIIILEALVRSRQTKTEVFTISVKIIFATKTSYEVMDLPSTKTEERRKWNMDECCWPTISFVDILDFSLFLNSKRVLLRVAYRECSSDERLLLTYIIVSTTISLTFSYGSLSFGIRYTLHATIQ